MKKVIIVAHPVTGALFTETKNSDFVKCQLKQSGTQVTNGVISLVNRVAFPAISAALAEEMEKNGLRNGDEFPIQGKIVRARSNAPFFEGQTPVTTKDGVVIMWNGAEYYQQYTFTTDMSAEEDTYVDATLVVQQETKQF